MKIYFNRTNVKLMFSLLSSAPLFISLSQLCFLLFYVGLALSHFLLCTFFGIVLSLSPYVFLEHFQEKERRKTEGDEEEEEEEEEEGQGEESYRNRHRSELVDS